MTRTLNITDETYERLTSLAKEADQTAEELLETWSQQVKERTESFHSLLAAPLPVSFKSLSALLAEFTPVELEAIAREIRLVVTAMQEAQEGRDPDKEPRHQTFEAFFHDLGMTDEQIADAQRRAADRANV